MWGVQTNYVVKVPTYSALLPNTAVHTVSSTRTAGYYRHYRTASFTNIGVSCTSTVSSAHSSRCSSRYCAASSTHTGGIPHTICGVFHTLICSEFRTFSGSLLTLLCRSSAHNCTVSFLHILLRVPYSIDNELCTFLMSSSQYCIVSSAHSAGCSSNYFAASSIHSLIMWWVQYGVLKPNASCAVIKNLRKYIKIQVTLNTNFVSVTFKNSATLTPTDFFYVKSRNCEFKGK